MEGEKLEERLKVLERDDRKEEEAGSSELRGNRSVYSKANRISAYNKASSRLSVREVDKIKRWMSKKDREKRRCNIVIRGIEATKEMEGDKNKGCTWIRELIKDKIGVE